MRAKAGLVTTLATVCLIGCTHLSPEERKIHVTEDRESVKPCTLLGRVRGSSTLSGTGMWGTWEDEDNEREMIEETHELAGNVLLVTGSKKGEAYRCPEPLPGAPFGTSPRPTPTN